MLTMRHLLINLPYSARIYIESFSLGRKLSPQLCYDYPNVDASCQSVTKKCDVH